MDEPTSPLGAYLIGERGTRGWTQTRLAEEAGIPLHVIARRVGHRDATTILRVYAHVLVGADREAADALAAVLTG
jgi:integrase